MCLMYVHFTLGSTQESEGEQGLCELHCLPVTAYQSEQKNRKSISILQKAICSICLYTV